MQIEKDADVSGHGKGDADGGVLAVEVVKEAGEPTKRLARTVAAEFGLRRSDVYARAVALSNSS